MLKMLTRVELYEKKKKRREKRLSELFSIFFIDILKCAERRCALALNEITAYIFFEGVGVRGCAFNIFYTPCNVLKFLHLYDTCMKRGRPVVRH